MLISRLLLSIGWLFFMLCKLIDFDDLAKIKDDDEWQLIKYSQQHIYISEHDGFIFALVYHIAGETLKELWIFTLINST